MCLFGVKFIKKIHLISHHLCPYVQRALIVLTEKNIAHERTYIDLANKPAWFNALSPLGRVPILETDDTVLFESQVIAEYLDETTPGSLHPITPLEKARHRSWIEFGSEILATVSGFYNAEDEKAFEQKRISLRAKLERIETEIVGPYFSGQSFHMIDGVAGTIFRYLDTFDRISDFNLMAGLENVSQWRRTVSKRSSVINATSAGYTDRLEQFLKQKGSHLSKLMKEVDLN